MILEKIKQILDEMEDVDPLEVKRLINMIDRNDPVDVVYKQEMDSLGVIWKTECPNCGETLRFDRYSQIIQTYNFCYKCGQRLKKNIEEKEKIAENDEVIASN